MRNVPFFRQAAYTLTELVIVVAILAVVAAIAVPVTRSSETDRKIDLIANEFATAMRFARSESIRTSKPHGFRFLTNQYRIRVFAADTTVAPWTWLWDVYHPVDKNLYDYTFPADLVGSTAPVTHTPVYRSSCSRPGAVYFDDSGTPWCLEPETALLDSYQLDIVIGAQRVTVNLDGITGRVTVL